MAIWLYPMQSTNPEIEEDDISYHDIISWGCTGADWQDQAIQYLEKKEAYDTHNDVIHKAKNKIFYISGNNDDALEKYSGEYDLFKEFPCKFTSFYIFFTPWDGRLVSSLNINFKFKGSGVEKNQ